MVLGHREGVGYRLCVFPLCNGNTRGNNHDNSMLWNVISLIIMNHEQNCNQDVLPFSVFNHGQKLVDLFFSLTLLLSV